MITHYIYGIFISSRVIYIGRTSDPVARCHSHMVCAMDQNRRYGAALYTVLHECLKKGIVPRFKIIDTCVDDEYLYKEKDYIRHNKEKLFGNTSKGTHDKNIIPPVKTKHFKGKVRKQIADEVKASVRIQLNYINQKQTA